MWVLRRWAKSLVSPRVSSRRTSLPLARNPFTVSPASGLSCPPPFKAPSSPSSPRMRFEPVPLYSSLTANGSICFSFAFLPVFQGFSALRVGPSPSGQSRVDGPMRPAPIAHSVSRQWRFGAFCRVPSLGLARKSAKRVCRAAKVVTWSHGAFGSFPTSSFAFRGGIGCLCRHCWTFCEKIGRRCQTMGYAGYSGSGQRVPCPSPATVLHQPPIGQ